MIKIRLFKFLGKFIPYFKKKIMDKSTLSKHIKIEVENHFVNFDANHSFNIDVSFNHFDNLNKTIIMNIRIEYQKFSVFLLMEYSGNNVFFSQHDFPKCGLEDFSELSKIINHFGTFNKTVSIANFDAFFKK